MAKIHPTKNKARMHAIIIKPNTHEELNSNKSSILISSLKNCLNHLKRFSKSIQNRTITEYSKLKHCNICLLNFFLFVCLPSSKKKFLWTNFKRHTKYFFVYEKIPPKTTAQNIHYIGALFQYTPAKVN